MKKSIAALMVIIMTLGVLSFLGACTPKEPDPVVDIGATPVPTETVAPPPETLSLTRQYADAMGMVAAGYIHSLGLRTDGSVLSAGHDYYAQRQVGDWTDVIYIAAGKSVSVGVKADGTLCIAGSLTDEAALATAAAWTNVFTADAGGDFIAALLNDGTVVAAGDNSTGACDVSAWSDIVAVACGDAFTVGLKADGTVIGTSGAPVDIANWKKITKLAAGGASAVAGITEAGSIVATCPITGLEGYTDIVALGADDYGVACVRADGSVVSALSADIVPDPDYAYGIEELSTVTDAAGIAVGEKHVVVMKRDGSAIGYGSTDDLQCDVGRFNLRPYVETLSDGSSVLHGLDMGMSVADAKALVAAVTGAADVQFAKVTKAEDGTSSEAPCADTDIVATGLSVKCDGAQYATVIIMGDTDGNGAVDAADREYIQKVSTNNIQPSPLEARPAQFETNDKGVLACTQKSLDLIDAYIAGMGAIAQYADINTGMYTQKYTECFDKNKDTVGYIAIPKTNIDYPIMFDKTGKWYYNDYTFDKEKSGAASIYVYYYGMQHNTVVTGHNARPETFMFHQLHHIQEFNLGETNCAHKKYCGVELVNLPDFKIYSNRVFSIYLFGQEHRYEAFAMYETEGNGNKDYKTMMNNVWWPYSGDFTKENDEQVQEWITEQIERSQIEFDTVVTPEDNFLTLFTCGNEHSDANNYARLYYICKEVD